MCRIDGCVEVFVMAHRNREYPHQALINNSDRDIQYCSDDYQKLLHKHKIKCNMTPDSSPYENAMTEIINGILKQEFSIDNYHLDFHLMKKIIAETVTPLQVSKTLFLSSPVNSK